MVKNGVYFFFFFFLPYFIMLVLLFASWLVYNALTPELVVAMRYANAAA
jgi:stringent starvation protein B